MNDQTFKAIINWLADERKSGIPFKNKKYAPLIEINGEKIFDGSAWSVICYAYEYIDENKTFAYIKFLNADVAPDILSAGTKFNLYEGANKVAFGKITEKYDCNLIP